MTDKLIVKTNGDILEIILNNPSKMNCMGFEMLAGLSQAIKDCSLNNDIKLLIVKGAGERAFSSGADLKEFQVLSREQTTRWIESGNKTFNELENLKIPTVAFINGYAMGGGLELALACDFRFATPSSVFCSPEVQHGWLPGWGGMTRLRRLVGEPKAKEVVLLGEKIIASRACEMGLITRIVHGEEDEEYRRIIHHLASLKISATGLAKAALHDEFRTTQGTDLWFDIMALDIK